MSQTTQRTQKLLVFVGEEGQSVESRDFKKVVQVIAQQYLPASRPSYQEFLLQIIPAVTRRVPLKQHIYAGLTAQIRRVKPQLSIHLVRAVIANLEKDLNSLKIHESINGILYLSELMNLEKLNSQCFFDMMDDIVVYLENCKNVNHRSFFVQLYSKTLHNFCYSLNKKVFYQFKKQLERVKKYCGKNIQFLVIFQLIQKGNAADGSSIGRLYQQLPKPSTEDQIQQNIKLKLSINQEQKFTPIQYYFSTPNQSDKLYQQFQRNQGQLHLTNIEQIIQLMKQSAAHLITKLVNYIKNQNEKTKFLERFSIELILGKGMKSQNTIIQSFIIVKLVQNNREYAELVQKSLQQGFLFDNESYDLGCQMKFAEIITYIANNWPTGQNDMTDIGLWDWDKIVVFNNQQQKNPANVAKRNVLLQIICEKLQLLGDGYKFPASLKQFVLPQNPRNPAKYKSAEQIETQQKFQNLLDRKSKSQQILPNIKSDGDYQIFLESLFDKTSQSHTHLQVLMNRYADIFIACKQDYDWTLLNVIRSNWEKSLNRRLLYIETVIEKGYVDFDSYVKYIAKVQTKNEEEAQMIKMELNQLHKLFAQKLKK